MRTIQEMIHSEVLCCMSHIVSTLAQSYNAGIWDGGKAARQVGNNLPDLCEQAAELCYPIPDYEEAAIQAGWRRDAAGQFWNGERKSELFGIDASWQELADFEGFEPYDCEVYEHWAVSDWFADKLIEQGEKVDKDFGNLCIWARPTTGQAVYCDGVVEQIYANMMQPVEA